MANRCSDKGVRYIYFYVVVSLVYVAFIENIVLKSINNTIL